MKANFNELTVNYSDKQLKDLFNSVVQETTEQTEYIYNLTKLFSFALDHDRKLITNHNITKNETRDYQLREFITNWCNGYISEKSQPASQRPLKNKGEKDPALIKRVNTAKKLESGKTLNDYLLGHQLYMSAENTNGKVLEEFLASILEKVGWIWCAGATIMAIDFIKITNDDYKMLQIKNKYNTENSSSNKIRTGKPIHKWYRLKKPSTKDPYRPRENWTALLEELNLDSYSEKQKEFLIDNLTEEKYLQYIANNTIGAQG